MSEVTISFRVAQSLEEQFTAAAKVRCLTVDQLLRDFMREYVEQRGLAEDDEAWFRREVQIGLDQANNGDVLTSEEMEADAASWRNETRHRVTSTGP
ncbi:MAG: hypothetical protein V4857_09520 [Pseudomonadota bacterium]